LPLVHRSFTTAYSNSPACPSCRSGDLALVGKIPASNIFAGRESLEPLDGGNLFHCRGCHLSFRFPRKTKEELSVLYSAGSDEAWECEVPIRADWKAARSWIEGTLRAGSSILDVGCFDGSFLQSLSPQYRCFGIEIQRNASRKAAAKNLAIIANRYDDLADISDRFDGIVAFDLIEHVHDPAYLLSLLANALVPSGTLIISSGNSDAITWRIMGSRYWYCAISEHISFINPRWCGAVVSGLGLRIERLTSFSHSAAPFHQKVLFAAKNLAYLAAPQGAAWMRKRGFGGKAARRFPVLAEHPPSWMSARDHFILFARKIAPHNTF